MSSLGEDTLEVQNAVSPLTDAKLIGNKSDVRLGMGGYGDVLLKEYEKQVRYVLSPPSNALIVQLFAVKVPKGKAPADTDTR